jgi:HD-like signal output (HDOD) protein
MLRAESKYWDLSFATGADEALALFASCQFDVVISDMRMENMDGAELLRRIRERNPATVRVVLSGQIDGASAVRAAGVAHQFLNKPTDPSTLRRAVSRTRVLEPCIGHTHLRRALGGLDGLPSPMSTVQSLNTALSDPTCDVDRVVRIVRTDLGLSSKLLQLVNSAFFALPLEVTDLHGAVAGVGLENVRAMAKSNEVFRIWRGDASFESLAARLQAHSLRVVQLAHHILPSPRRPADLFLGSLLHDLGLLATAAVVPELFAALACRASGPWTLHEERTILGATQGDIGAYLLCLWGMSDGAVEIVRYHHDRRGPTVHLDEADAVFLADALCAEVDDVPGHVAGLSGRDAEELDVTDRVDEWRRYRDELTQEPQRAGNDRSFRCHPEPKPQSHTEAFP